ncbi:MAG: protein kinase, partial [Myxococcales bacterium]|nr:protein kinase [Myxococcales bacterium]
GGMGRVYEAIDDALDRPVAIKVLLRHVSQGHRQRLLREAQALAKLSHPNVVQVYEVGEAEGEVFVAMELVRGQTLWEWVERDPRPSWRACVEVYRQAGLGLAAAHAEGLVHRDFKPGNAIVDDKGRVRVLDFGLARRRGEGAGEGSSEAETDGEPNLDELGADPRLTVTGTVLGTPAYMPLEQMEGRETDARSDQFGFCVSLYEAVYSERPFRGESIAALMTAMVAEHVRPAPRGTAVPMRLRRVLLRGLARDPARRWDSMDELLAELERLVAPPPRRGRALGLATGLLAAGLGLGLYAREGDQEPPGEPEGVDRAEQLYEAGKLAYRKGSFQEAVDRWSEAYDLSERPLLLYNIALGLEKQHELSGDIDDLLRARSVMRSFLVIATADPNVDPGDAQQQVEALDARIAALTGKGGAEG